MKIRQEHLSTLKTNIDEILAKYPSLVDEYEHGKFPRSDKVKDLQKRFCFDVLYGAGLTAWVCEELYAYLDDSHLYTALKTVCPAVTKKY